MAVLSLHGLTSRARYEPYHVMPDITINSISHSCESRNPVLPFSRLTFPLDTKPSFVSDIESRCE
ncbi:hypothetical protein ACFLSV_05600 [Bacteroidota bacterium]